MHMSCLCYSLYTCQLSLIIHESHACGLKTSISRIKDNFSRLTHKSGPVVLKKPSFHFRFVMYYFFALYNNRKSLQISTIRSNHKCSKVIGISSDIFGNVGKSSENRRKTSEVARTFSEILVMTRQKSHAFDSEKVNWQVYHCHTLFMWHCLAQQKKRYSKSNSL